MTFSNDNGQMDFDKVLGELHEDYRELEPEEKSALKDFAAAWAVFDGCCAKVLGCASGTSINIPKLIDVSEQLFDKNTNELDRTKAAIEYWRHRLSAENECGGRHFNDLRVPEHLKYDVLKALRETSGDSFEILKAALIIVYRLRCNLFHGEKERLHFSDQKCNFEHATQVMLESIQNMKSVGFLS